MGLSTFKISKRLKQTPNSVTLTDEQVRQLQEKLLDIFDDIYEVCLEQNINVMLAHGNVIGALRHNGFIPWDDDMDIYIFRNEYSKFIDAFRKKFEDKYWIHEPCITHDYGSLITKILLKNTVARKYEDMYTDECGIFIDVFILENEFDSLILRKLHSLIEYVLIGCLSCRRFKRDAQYIIPFAANTDDLKTIKKKECVGKILSFFSIDTWTKLALKWAKLCKNDNSRQVHCAGLIPLSYKKYWDRNTFQKKRLHDYEGQQLPIPFNAEKYLSDWYGDYMKMPPVEKRERHTYQEFKL